MCMNSRELGVEKVLERLKDLKAPEETHTQPRVPLQTMTRIINIKRNAV